jgi:hypothetical protein
VYIDTAAAKTEPAEFFAFENCYNQNVDLEERRMLSQYWGRDNLLTVEVVSATVAALENVLNERMLQMRQGGRTTKSEARLFLFSGSTSSA